MVELFLIAWSSMIRDLNSLLKSILVNDNEAIVLSTFVRRLKTIFSHLKFVVFSVI